MDVVSESRLSQVHPVLAARIRQLYSILLVDGTEIHVTQGLRTYAQQSQLYGQGRTSPGPIVTDAHAGYSMHNFGLAVDLDPFNAEIPDWNAADVHWQDMLDKALTCKLAEGAKWRTFPDKPHFYPVEIPADPDDNMRYLFSEGGLQAVWSEYALVSVP